MTFSWHSFSLDPSVKTYGNDCSFDARLQTLITSKANDKLSIVHPFLIEKASSNPNYCQLVNRACNRYGISTTTTITNNDQECKIIKCKVEKMKKSQGKPTLAAEFTDSRVCVRMHVGKSVTDSAR